jgi:hypothetical protein
MFQAVSKHSSAVKIRAGLIQDRYQANDGTEWTSRSQVWPDDELRVCAQKYIKTAIKQQKRDIPKPPLAD